MQTRLHRPENIRNRSLKAVEHFSLLYVLCSVEQTDHLAWMKWI